MNVLNQKCLVVNRNWIVVNERTVEEAISMVFAGAACVMDVMEDGNCVPVSLDQWLKLPLRPGLDQGIHTSRMTLREPRIIVAVEYSKIPKRRPKLCAKSIREREHNRCAYTGKLLR